MKKLLAFLSILILFTSAPICAALPQYVVHDLGTFGGSAAYLNAINSQGHVAGSVRLADGSWRAFLKTDGVLDLGEGGASDLNDSDMVIGTAGTAVRQGWYWDGTRHVINEGIPAGLNNQGTIVGGSIAQHRGYVLQPGTAAQVIPSLGGLGSGAEAVNGRGQVVGWAEHWSLAIHAFLWDNGGMYDLGTLGGKDSYAWDVNGAGVTVGEADAPYDDAIEDYLHYAVYWDAAHQIHPIGEGTALAISGTGTIAGYSLRGAWVWRDNSTTWLPSDGFSFTKANDINENGWIAGSGYASDGSTHAVLWEPVPEPGTALVLLSGLTGCATLRLRARRTRG